MPTLPLDDTPLPDADRWDGADVTRVGRNVRRLPHGEGRQGVSGSVRRLPTADVSTVCQGQRPGGTGGRPTPTTEPSSATPTPSEARRQRRQTNAHDRTIVSHANALAAPEAPADPPPPNHRQRRQRPLAELGLGQRAAAVGKHGCELVERHGVLPVGTASCDRQVGLAAPQRTARSTTPDGRIGLSERRLRRR